MDKKKLLIVGLLILLVLSIFISFIFLMSREDSEDAGGDNTKDNPELVEIYDPEEEFQYSKDSLLATASKEIKEIQGVIEEDKNIPTDKEDGAVDNNSNKDTNTESVDYTNFFGPDNSKEIDKVKQSVRENNHDDIDDVVNEVKEKYKDIEKPVETNLSKDISSKLGENKIGLKYVGFGDYMVDAKYDNLTLFGIGYNKKVPLSDREDSVGYDEGNISIGLLKKNKKYYNLEDYSENLINLFKYAGLNEKESETVFNEFKNMYDKDVKTLKDSITNHGYYSEYKFILNKKVLISYEDSLVFIIIY